MTRSDETEEEEELKEEGVKVRRVESSWKKVHPGEGYLGQRSSADSVYGERGIE